MLAQLPKGVEGKSSVSQTPFIRSKKSYQFGLHGKKYYYQFSNQLQLKTIDLTPSCRKHIFWWLGFSQWYFMPCTFLVRQIVFIGFMVRKQFFGFLIGDLVPRYLQMCHFYTIFCLKFKYLKYLVLTKSCSSFVWYHSYFWNITRSNFVACKNFSQNLSFVYLWGC